MQPAETGATTAKVVLDPVDRASEVIFGLLMAMTFVGSLSVASDGREEVRTMMIAALGCNLAWGLVDAIMFIMNALLERGHNLTILKKVIRAESKEGHGSAFIIFLPKEQKEKSKVNTNGSTVVDHSAVAN